MPNDTVISEFNDALKQFTVTAVCGRSFVLVDKLQNWLRSSIGPQETRAGYLLDIAYSPKTSPGTPITPLKFQVGNDCCLLTFCILHEIGCGNKIDVFSRKGKVDSILPLRKETLHDVFKAASIDETLLLSRFYEQQHRFRPAKFEYQREDDWEEDMILPIYQKDPITEGGTAKLYQISVPEDCVGPDLRLVSSGSKFNKGSDQEPDWWYQFALKSFPKEQEETYKNEVKALRALCNHDGMVRWLANFSKTDALPRKRGSSSERNPEGKTTMITYNILLEYGEMDLNNYFEKTMPPVLPLEIRGFWRDLFAVADAVRSMHRLTVREAGEDKQYYGWHADIKPENILYIEDRLDLQNALDGDNPSKHGKGEKMFRLADPGFAAFVAKPQGDGGDVPKKHLVGGTATYGAPEYPGWSREPVSQAIDIWSLGCVFSLAATWIVLGRHGAVQFERMREMAIHKINGARQARDMDHDRAMKKSGGDFFHDGRQVLEVVTQWHLYLRNLLRPTDNITSQVLDLVDVSMFLGDADLRIKADELCDKLQSIMRSGAPQIKFHLPDTFTASLGQIDAEATYEAATTRRSRLVGGRNSSSNGTIMPGNPDIPVVDRPRMTTHRQSYWPHRSLRLYEDASRPDTIESPDSRPAIVPMTTTAFPPSGRATGYGQLPSKSTTQTTDLRLRLRGTSNRKYLNVFQAQEVVEKQRKVRGLSLSRMKFTTGKSGDGIDEFLAAHFRENRDIIYLVDNAESMKLHWNEATFVLRTLVALSKGLDGDGMDLRFTTGSTKLEGKDSAERFEKAMAKARPTNGVHTDLTSTLSDLLEMHASRVAEKNRWPYPAAKDITLIVLTDGIWAGMADRNLVAKQLKDHYRQLHASKHMKPRTFSVQFVQFGSDMAATQLLQHLDDDLADENIQDFVDTEPSYGNVIKMLLGSFVTEYDQDETIDSSIFDDYGPRPDTADPITSPSSSHSHHSFTQSESYSPRSPNHFRGDSGHSSFANH